MGEVDYALIILYNQFRGFSKNTIFAVSKQGGNMNSTEKVLWLLNRLGDPPYDMGLTELSKEIGFSKGGIYKILTTLVENGFVVQDSHTKKYNLGPALHRLGNIYSEQKGIYEASQPVMKAISEITKETVSIGIREGNDAILAYKIEGPKIVRLYRKVGLKFPMNAGAIGKLLAAYHDTESIEQILQDTELQAKTDNTIINPEKLLKEFEKIRKNGYAISDEENGIGNFGIAAPIYDANGEVWSCLSLAGSKEEFNEKRIKTWIPIIVNGAMEISYKLGY